MRIVMITNTYLPHVGGVAQSVKRFTEAYRENGHDVLVVAPEFPDASEDENDVVRIPALQEFSGSDFSVSLPVPLILSNRLDKFKPEIIHSHHPFLLGDSALRAAAARGLPLVYTHHTLYEHYTHYVPVEADGLRELAIELQTGYSNRVDHVIAPSTSVKKLIESRGVKTPVSVIPTGVDTAPFRDGNREKGRKELGISADGFVIGHVGRLAEEKNLPFLAKAICRAVEQHENTYALIVGSGPSEKTIERIFREKGLKKKLVMPGSKTGEALINAYHAMDVFAFASKTETQGMVLVEAMAAGVPVIALDATGSRDVIEDEKNGRLVENEDVETFAERLGWFLSLSANPYEQLRQTCRKRAEELDTERCAEKALALYEQVIDQYVSRNGDETSAWDNLLDRLREEWEIWHNRASAVGAAVSEEEKD
jgi:glycosyltransferase involved in cell wall biosynthesis